MHCNCYKVGIELRDLLNSKGHGFKKQLELLVLHPFEHRNVADHFPRLNLVVVGDERVFAPAPLSTMAALIVLVTSTETAAQMMSSPGSAASA